MTLHSVHLRTNQWQHNIYGAVLNMFVYYQFLALSGQTGN